MTQSTITRSMTEVGRATRAGAFTAMLAIIGLIAVTASVKTARAADQQQTEAGQDNEFNWKAAGPAYALAPQPGAYASAHRDRAIAARHKSFREYK